jgi:NitT/TauT family transport system substrate-binding protein
MTGSALLRRLALMAFIVPLSTGALAMDKVRVATFLASSELPYYIALERGYFRDVDIEVEGIPFVTTQLILQSVVTGDVDAVSILNALEMLNVNVLRPNTAVFISLNGQNSKYQIEQFVARVDFPARSLRDLKGARLFSAPGPANMGVARGVLKANGLEAGKDYTLQELPMGVQLSAIKGRNFDAGYTLEPVASLMVQQGAAKRLEVGVISKYLLGDKDAMAITAGGALSAKFIRERPEVAARYARAWARAISDANNDPTVRNLLVKYMNIPASLAPTIPLVHFAMVKDLDAAEIANLQRYCDFGVQIGVVRKPIDVKTVLKAY